MRAPVSLLLFIPQIIVFALQLFPIPGVAMMILAAPVWAVVLLNGPMVACAIESARTPGLRAWLLLPALWFGGYAAFVGADTMQGARARMRADAANAEVHVPFDPQRHALVLLGDGSELGHVDNRAIWFVANTNVPVAYLKSNTFKDLGFAGVRLVSPEFCFKKGVLDVRDLEAGIREQVLFMPRQPGLFRSGRDFDKKACTRSAPEKIARQTMTARFERATHGDPIVEVTLTTADGRRWTLRGADPRPSWPWIPMPSLGCGLAMSEWRCGFAFLRTSKRPTDRKEGDLDGTNALLAQALGVKRVAAEDRCPTTPAATVRESGDHLRDRMARQQFASVEQILAEPDKAAEWQRFDNLAVRADLVHPSLEQIIAAMERGQSLGVDTVDYENARILFELVQRLPDEMLEPHRERLSALASRDPKFGCRFASMQPGDPRLADTACVTR